VLHCDKPGTGSVDAPRASNIKLKLVVVNDLGFIPSSTDGEFCTKFIGERLVCTIAIHVDDLKIAGERDVVDKVMTKLQQVFGETRVIWHDFTNCGVRRVQDPRTEEVTLDQIVYVHALRPISFAELQSAKNEDKRSAELTTLYQSLLGAVAYATHTRVDACVFISALQRHNASPLIIHAKRLNRLTRWLQRNPKKLHFTRFTVSERSSLEADRFPGETPTHTFATSAMLPSAAKATLATLSAEPSLLDVQASPQLLLPCLAQVTSWITTARANDASAAAPLQQSSYLQETQFIKGSCWPNKCMKCCEGS